MTERPVNIATVKETQNLDAGQNRADLQTKSSTQMKSAFAFDPVRTPMCFSVLDKEQYRRRLARCYCLLNATARRRQQTLAMLVPPETPQSNESAIATLDNATHE